MSRVAPIILPMNPKEYAEKAIHLGQITLRQDLPIEEAAALVLRTGYPEPQYGVELFASHRGNANNGIDWPMRHLRKAFAQLIENVAEDCISLIEGMPEIDSAFQQKAASAIREHFEIKVN